MRLRYVNQKEQLGTGHALLMAKPFITGRFIVMAGDDLYSKQDIKACVKHGNSILVATHGHPENFGVIREKEGKLTDIIEKPKNPPSNLINTSFYVLEKGIFDLLSKTGRSNRGEIELTDAVKAFAKQNTLHCVRAKQHLAIGYPWDLLKADSTIRKGKNAIGKDSTIEGKVVNSSIGDNCVISGTVRDSIIMENSIVEKGSIITHSVIGAHAVFDGKIQSQKNATSLINSKKAKAGDFGAALGDYVTAKKAILSAGVKIWPKKSISGTIKSDVT